MKHMQIAFKVKIIDVAGLGRCKESSKGDIIGHYYDDILFIIVNDLINVSKGSR